MYHIWYYRFLVPYNDVSYMILQALVIVQPIAISIMLYTTFILIIIFLSIKHAGHSMLLCMCNREHLYSNSKCWTPNPKCLTSLTWIEYYISTTYSEYSILYGYYSEYSVLYRQYNDDSEYSVIHVQYTEYSGYSVIHVHYTEYSEYSVWTLH